jgi:hypothetical protein
LPGTPDNIVAPKPFTVDLVGGALSVTLAPSLPGWAWSVLESVDGVKDERYFVTVPDVPEIDDADLPRVDPRTLAPTAEPVAAWWAVAGATVTAGEIVGDDLLLTRTDGETVNAGSVRGPEGKPGTPGQNAVGGGFAIDPSDPDVILISTFPDSGIVTDPNDGDVLLLPV